MKKPTSLALIAFMLASPILFAQDALRPIDIRPSANRDKAELIYLREMHLAGQIAEAQRALKALDDQRVIAEQPLWNEYGVSPDKRTIDYDRYQFVPR